MRPIHKLLSPVLALLLVAAVAGCGSDDSSETSTGADTDRVTEVTAEREDGDAIDADDSDADDERADPGSNGTSDLPDFGQFGEFGACMELYAVFGMLFLGPAIAMGMVPPEEVAELEAQMGDLQAQVPAELRDDFDTVLEAFTGLADEMGTIDFEQNPGALFDPAMAERMEAAGAAMETPEFEEAMENIEAYLEAECGELGN